MSLTAIIVLGLLSGLTFTLAWGAFEDLTNRVIPHAVVFVTAGLWLIYIATGHGDWMGGLIAATAFLVVGFGLFYFNLMGGGDVKLMSAVGLWTGLSYALPFVFYMTVAGGVVAAGVLVTHRFRLRAAGMKSGDGDEQTVPTVPYGLAIAFGGILAVWQAALTEVT